MSKKIYEVHVYADGSKYWFINGKLHREDGPAVEYAFGSKEWFINGKLHREDGPAVENVDGSKKWFINGKCNKEDGPAAEYADGSKEWWIDGTQFTESEFNSRNKCENKIVEIDGKKYKLVPVE